MEKLVITVTCDTTLTYPHNPNGPKPDNPTGVADEYVRAINAGASICHVHGSYVSDTEIQPDGRLLQIPIMEGWAEITERIRDTGSSGRAVWSREHSPGAEDRALAKAETRHEFDQLRFAR